MTTLCFNLNNADPYFNLAVEEHLLKNFTEDIFMLWRSESSIVVGKHQNALAEINHQYVRENNISVARRLSGGGTVFHDPGNVNFTFIKNVEKLEEVNFKVFTQPIISVLQKLGLGAYTTGRNDLMIGGKKISGNAEHVYRKRVLHHGTLLFDSHLGKLRSALNVNLSRFEHRAVQSNRSEVTNIAGHLPNKMSIDEFAEYVFTSISQIYKDTKYMELGKDDILEIEKLRDEKYCQWDWIYGYSPKYKYHNKLVTEKGEITFSFQVEKGKIVSSDWGGAISEKLSALLSEKLHLKNHSFDGLKLLIDEIKQDLINEDILPGHLLELMI